VTGSVADALRSDSIHRNCRFLAQKIYPTRSFGSQVPSARWTPGWSHPCDPLLVGHDTVAIATEEFLTIDTASQLACRRESVLRSSQSPRCSVAPMPRCRPNAPMPPQCPAPQSLCKQ
jgi:hypothetical protein